MVKTLRVVTSVYAVLYVAGAVSALFNEEFRMQLAVSIQLVIFLAGYVVIWKNEIYGGMVFILWWIGMWYVGYVLSETDRGVAVVVGFPLFVLAILHIISGYRSRKARQETVQVD
jgi:hypothetical protein